METSEARDIGTDEAASAENTADRESEVNVNNAADPISMMIAQITAAIPEIVRVIGETTREQTRADATLQREIRSEDRDEELRTLVTTLDSIVRLGPDIREASDVVATATGGKSENIAQALIDGILINQKKKKS